MDTTVRVIPRLLRVRGLLVPVGDHEVEQARRVRSAETRGRGEEGRVRAVAAVQDGGGEETWPPGGHPHGQGGDEGGEARLRSELGRRLRPLPGADLVLRTSGSTTGSGRLVAMSVRALVASALATHARLGGPGTWVLALPPHHVAGLQVLVRSLVAGTRPVVLDLGGGFDPRALGAAVAAAAGRPDAGAQGPTGDLPSEGMPTSPSREEGAVVRTDDAFGQADTMLRKDGDAPAGSRRPGSRGARRPEARRQVTHVAGDREPVDGEPVIDPDLAALVHRALATAAPGGGLLGGGTLEGGASRGGPPGRGTLEGGAPGGGTASGGRRAAEGGRTEAAPHQPGGEPTPGPTAPGPVPAPHQPEGGQRPEGRLTGCRLAGCRLTREAVAGRVYVSLVPTQLHRVLEDPVAASGLARAHAVLVGGAAASPALLDRAREAGIAVVTTYGMTETGGGCVYDGLPLEGVRVRVEGPEGRIVLSGPMVAEGYADAGPSGAVRRGADGPEVWTSDRGRLGPDGRLTVLGRLDDLIVTGGLKVDPHQVEAVLEGVDGVAQACVVGVPDEEWGSAVVAAVVPAAGAGLDPEAVRVAARALLDGAHAPKRVHVLPDLPLRGPGKVDRRALAALLARGPG